MSGALAQLRIESIAGGGAGVGRLDGMAVFVHRTAPGELVEVEIRRTAGERKRFAEAELTRVIERSVDRIEPACRHYVDDRCGGCQLQHLSYPAQLLAKQKLVSDALTRIGKRSAAVRAAQPSPAHWRYRNKLTLTMRPHQRESGRGGAWTIGLRPLGRPNEVFDLKECPITSDDVMTGWGEVRSAAALLPQTDELRGSLRAFGAERSFHLEGGLAWKDAPEFVRSCPSLTSIRWRDGGGRTHDLLAMPDGARPATTFSQVNEAVGRAVLDRVVHEVEGASARTAVDAYAGSGETARRLVALGIQVTAIELDADAARLAQAGLPPRGQVVRGRVEDVIARHLPADAVILNPPRTGVELRVTAALEKSSRSIRKVVYVSCDPATFARDIARLPSFEIESMEPFDMFPQTAHVETVCVLRGGAW